MDCQTACRDHRILSSFAFLLTLLFASKSSAILLQALPSASDVAVGDQFRINLVISGLEQQSPPEIVRGYHLDLGYTPDITAATDVAFGDMLRLSSPLSSIFQKSELTNGNVMLEELSLWGDSVLDLAQPDSFMLASVGFVAMDAGTVNFDFTPYLNFGIDIKGLNADVLPVTSMGGAVNIHGVTIPAPTTIFLLGIGLLGMAILKTGR